MSYAVRPTLLKNVCMQGRNVFYPSVLQTRFEVTTSPFLFGVGQHRMFSTVKSIKEENRPLFRVRSDTLLSNDKYALQPIWCRTIHSSQILNKYGLTQVKAKLSDVKNVLLKDLKEIKSAPGPVLMFGGILVAPFVLFPILVSNTSLAELAYGACMLSFFGGIRWGASLSKPSDSVLGPSVAPAMIGCLALIVPEPIGGLVIITGLVSTAYNDIITAGYPPWLKGLRSVIALVGGSMILLTAVF